MRRHLSPYLQPVVTFPYLTGWRIKSEVLSLQWRSGGLPDRHAAARGWPDQEQGRADLSLRSGARAEGLPGGPAGCHRGAPAADGPEPGRKRAGRPASPGASARLPADGRADLEQAGVPRSTAMAMTRHKTEAVFRRYAIVDDANVARGAAKLAAFSEAQAK